MDVDHGIVRLQALLSQPEPVQRAAGGKARGLAQLMAWGLTVPDGVVVVRAGAWLKALDGSPQAVSEALQSVLEALGPGKVAVRSSSAAEDGAQASFAGQYLSVLNLETVAEVRDAMGRCLESARAASVLAYEQAIGGGGGDLSLVIQRQVPAQKAGALFTVDPVSGETGQAVIDAVPGLGDGLMAGHVVPEHWVVSRAGAEAGAVVTQTPSPDGPILPEAQVKQLLNEALGAEARAGMPLDLEWAIDGQGRLFWLQARPITTLHPREGEPEEEPGEFDVPDTMLLTTYNVGEILPGAVTPLTWSYLSRALEAALGGMMQRCGVPASVMASVSLVPRFHGHLFLNLSKLYLMTCYVAGTSKEETDFALAGHVLPEVPLPPRAGLLTRVRNVFRYGQLLTRSAAEVPKLAAQIPRGFPTPASTPQALLAQLREHVALATTAACVHVQTSATSSVLHTVILRILSQGKRPEVVHHGQAAQLLTQFEDVESADVVKQLELMARLVRQELTLQERLLQASSREALEFLLSPVAGKFGQRFQDFLGVHGHRGIREAELRARDWAEDPLQLVELLRNQLRQGKPPGHSAQPGAESAIVTRPAREVDPFLAIPSPVSRFMLRKTVAWARKAVQNRERTKSLTILPMRQARRIVLRLAALLVQEQRLPDEDLIFFLTSDELERLVPEPQPGLVQKAQRRRHRLAQQQGLQMPRYCLGRPVPEVFHDETPHALEMTGLPVSLGRVEGRARVVRTLVEAESLQPGEILIVQYTDVGWTPYFALAAGVATEIGSPISHGAVVAREYGIPAVTNLPGATRRFKTGDRVRLDGIKGTVTRLDD